ncbi:DEAD/DEAH box helicase [Micromonospora carbonacea]|uniref:DEAD/DEAH box helicase n=1 Tax=Micromonospora carbonacea TaxID=47853 RepID=A0A7H8XEN1_9ACTN|nr:DEAD/DEAH box helicase [Micromonospora carbonacea]MBB5829555.1 SNF2 family DNA or RNA helicase [Micromonospora carbonacea]QLD23040.1 DEAD/DEAH box helicase [Micromonospora carbonacea]
MIVAELYQQGRPLVVVTRQAPAVAGAWARLQASMSRGIVGGSADRMEVRVDVFLAELTALREVRTVFSEPIRLGPTLQEQIRSLISDQRRREDVAAGSHPTSPDTLAAQLAAAGFRRHLRGFQLENLALIQRLPHGADFSVPGAGKTTVALANYTLMRARKDVEQLLVIAPLAAFEAWREDAAACFERPPRIATHAGAVSIDSDVELLLTSYNRVASDYDRIRGYVGRRPTHVILDEAHRVKRGAQGVHGRAVLDLAYAARRRDILTGTPAPQGAFDLIALMRFLYPGQDQRILPASAYNERAGRDDDVLSQTSAAIQRYFVRTPKSRLGLPSTTFDVITQMMSPIQQAIYSALLGRYRGDFELDRPTRRQFDRLGRVIMYLLEAATNPMLLVAGSDDADELGFIHPPLALDGSEPLADLLARYRDYETPWKYEHVKALLEQARERGEKVIVWSTFVRNIRSLATHLKSFQPAIVHGGIPTRDSAPNGTLTREAELDRFRHDRDCHVLLANPAACGEGISLHHWCHHAIYLDRTFNAGHFLQSQDRIHRLGLKDNVTTRFTLLLSEGSIDETVNIRLREKITALSTLMDDPGLVRVALPEQDDDTPEHPAASDDMEAIASHVKARLDAA